MKIVRPSISDAVDEIRLVDTHEHIMAEEDRSKYAIDFSYLFAQYKTSDLVSAGMNPGLMEAVRLPMHDYVTAEMKRLRFGLVIPEPEREDMSLGERWEALEPYWEAIRNTASARQTLVAIRDLFDVEDLNRETYQELSSKIAASRRSGWYREVLKEKAGIAVAVQDKETTKVDLDLFVPVVRMDSFVAVSNLSDVTFLAQQADLAIHSLDDLVKAMRKVLEMHIADGAVGIKSLLAYRRTLAFDKVPKHQAEDVFNRISEHLGEGPSWSEAKPMQDYVFHQLIRAAIDAKLPMQIHTGFTTGNRSMVTDSNPVHLINLFIEYPEARFSLLHGGYPYVHELAALARTFANVFPDLAWLYTVSSEIGRQLLHELIEMVPANKIMAFGGDAVTVEMAYGYSRAAREIVALVLSEKVEQGYLRERAAIALGERILRENPAEFFSLSLDK